MDESSSPSASLPAGVATATPDIDLNSMMNLSLLDPPSFGWAAVGGIVNVLTPHERARRESTRERYLKAAKEKENDEARTRERERDSQIDSSSEPSATASVDESGSSKRDAAPCENQNVNLDSASDSRRAPIEVAPASVGDSGATRSLSDALDDAASTSSGPLLKVTVQPGLKPTRQNIQLEHTFGSSEPMLAQIGDPSSGLEEPAKKKAPATTTFSSNSNEEAPAAPTRDNRKRRSMEVPSALSDQGVLDMHAYHRGREGSEPRSEVSGCLLCEEAKTDTNHDWEPPKLCTNITVCFPLVDEESDSRIENPLDTRRRKEDVARYREIVEWDLSDPTTQTPLVFATHIAAEFGLSFAQTLDLASSIQRQLDAFARKKVSYKPPVSLNDPYGNCRPTEDLVSHVLGGAVQLYGGVNTEVPGGVQFPREMCAALDSQSGDDDAGSSDERVGGARKSLPGGATRPQVEQEYRAEVQRRAKVGSKNEIQRLSSARDEKVVGALSSEADVVCHLCRSRCRRGVRFACGIGNHTMCLTHAEDRFGVQLNGGDARVLDFCPLCSLTCRCRKCSRRLDSVALVLKEKSLEQDVTPDGTIFDEAFALCKRASLGNMRRTPKVSEKKRTTVTVPKVPASEFPREVCGGRDLDPGTPDDYRTVYTTDGIFVRNDVGSPLSPEKKASLPSPSPVGTVPEDGNVDYCNICMKTGNLFCCDRCPRAFHPECMDAKDKATGEETHWECHVCEKEKEGVPDDVVTGKESLRLILPSCSDLQHSSSLLQSLRVLAMVHEMITKLVTYDFGPVFRSPVDRKLVPGYNKIIKHPMDLGTIGSKLVDGSYLRLYKENQSWDDVIAPVLQDIELVWHNCFIFNFEGSSVFRMAEVQRRKSANIQKRSFDHLLSETVKGRVKVYVQRCEEQRGKIVRGSSGTNPDHRSRGKNKIIVPVSVGRTARSVAVLDPDTGLVVKIYTTIKAACLAATFLAGLGNAVEYTTFAEGTLRTLLRKSHVDPRALLFGHRWVYLDDLQGRKVRFGDEKEMEAKPVEQVSGFVHMKDGGFSYMFVSVEEALCFPDLPKEVPLDEIRKRLSECPIGEWRSIVGRSWRRILPPDGISFPERRTQQPLLENRMTGIQNPFSSAVTILKEDLISRCVLLGFDSLEAAYGDWLRTREGSPISLPREQDDIEYFKSYYLSGPRNVDGIIWRRLPPRIEQGTNGVSNSGVTKPNLMSASSTPTNWAKKHQLDVINGRPQLVTCGIAPGPNGNSGRTGVVESANDHSEKRVESEDENTMAPNSLEDAPDEPLNGLLLADKMRRSKREREDDGGITENHHMAKKINV